MIKTIDPSFYVFVFQLCACLTCIYDANKTKCILWIESQELALMSLLHTCKFAKIIPKCCFKDILHLHAHFPIDGHHIKCKKSFKGVPNIFSKRYLAHLNFLIFYSVFHFHKRSKIYEFQEILNS